MLRDQVSMCWFYMFGLPICVFPDVLCHNFQSHNFQRKNVGFSFERSCISTNFVFVLPERSASLWNVGDS